MCPRNEIEFDQLLETLINKKNDAWVLEARWDKLSHQKREQLRGTCTELLAQAYELQTYYWQLCDAGAIDTSTCTRAENIGHVLHLVGAVHLDMKKPEMACGILRQAFQLGNDSAYIFESLVKALLFAGHVDEAANLVNHVPIELIASEQRSTAQKIIEMAASNLAFAAGLNAERVKECVELAAEYAIP